LGIGGWGVSKQISKVSKLTPHSYSSPPQLPLALAGGYGTSP